MKPFKCHSCGGHKSHKIQRVNPDTKETVEQEYIFDIRSLVFDQRTVLRACDSCHIVRADWEKITEADDLTDEVKNLVALAREKDKQKIDTEDE